MDRPADGSGWYEGDGADPAWTAPESIRLDYLAPPADLQPYITTFYLFRCDEPLIRDVQPAAVGHLQIYLRGSGRMHYPHGRTDRSFPETIQGPTTIAAPKNASVGNENQPYDPPVHDRPRIKHDTETTRSVAPT